MVLFSPKIRFKKRNKGFLWFYMIPDFYKVEVKKGTKRDINNKVLLNPSKCCIECLRVP